MKKFLFALLFVVLFAGSGIANPLDAFKDLEGTLDIAGGTAHIPVMTQAAQDIMTFNPKIRITVAGGGSGVGVKQVGEGLAGIGNTGRSSALCARSIVFEYRKFLSWFFCNVRSPECKNRSSNFDGGYNCLK